MVTVAFFFSYSWSTDKRFSENISIQLPPMQKKNRTKNKSYSNNLFLLILMNTRTHGQISNTHKAGMVITLHTNSFHITHFIPWKKFLKRFCLKLIKSTCRFPKKAGINFTRWIARLLWCLRALRVSPKIFIYIYSRTNVYK